MSEEQSIDLNRLIQERRSEKRNVLRERLRHKLEAIRGGNIKPFPEGTFEKLQSINVWINVLDYVTEPSDVRNSSDACVLFSEILVEKLELMAHLLLPQTLSILGKRMSASLTNDICLKIRRTAKSWKKVAEAYLLESFFSGESWYLNMDKDIKAIPVPRMCIFNTIKSVDLAIASLPSQDLSFNSSLIRKICVDDIKVPARDIHTFHEKIMHFLEKHGQSVWLLQFRRLQCPTRLIAETYSRFLEILETVPNLKALILQNVIDMHIDWEEYPAFPNLHESFNFNERPFPVLPSLQHLHCVDNEDHVFLTQIFQSCVNLKSVIYPDLQIAPEEMVTALKKLTLERYDGHWENNVDSVARLPIIFGEGVVWPLVKLRVNFDGDFGVVRASDLFPALNKFQDTLRHLHLEVSLFGIEIDTDLRLELPNLTYLCMDNIGHACSWVKIRFGFDHLLSLKSLEKVVILEILRDTVNAHIKVEGYLERGDMNQSNVWPCFPNMLTIQYRWKIYKRPTQI